MAASFQDKVVIITGASNGIGAATAALFAEQGAKIAGFDIREATAPATENRMDIKVDVSSEEQVIAAVRQVVDTWGTVDVLCNVAGITDNMQGVTDTTNENLERIMGINFLGPLYLMRHVIPYFLAKPGKVEGVGYATVLPHKGSIVNVGSVASVKGAAAGALYTASKHALLGLSRNTSWMYNKEGVRTNIVFPGGVMTNIMAHSGLQGMDPAASAILGPAHAAMPAACTADDIAKGIVFLAGANAVNGAELSIDHAWTVA